MYEKQLTKTLKLNKQQQSYPLFNQERGREQNKSKANLQKVHLDNSTSIQFKCKLLKNCERRKTAPTSEVNLPHTHEHVHSH